MKFCGFTLPHCRLSLTFAAAFIGGGTLAHAQYVWEPQSVSFTATLWGVAAGNGVFVAVGDDDLILSSIDGTRWRQRDPGTTNRWFRGVGFGEGTFVAVGLGGLLCTSTNGLSWVVRSSGSSALLCDAAAGDGTFVAVGDQGTVLTSTNLVAWSNRASGAVNALEAVTFGHGQFVAVGFDGEVLTSTNGVSWTRQNSGSNRWLRDVAYGLDLYVAVGEAGSILTSPDGMNWTPQDAQTSGSLWGVEYGGGCFVAAGRSGTILTSEDGSAWTPRDSGTPDRWLTKVAGNEDVIVAVGTYGAVTRSLIAPANPLRLTEPRARADGAFEFTLDGATAGQALTVYWTASLTNWAVLTNLTAGPSPSVVVDPFAVGAAYRFYRVSSP